MQLRLTLIARETITCEVPKCQREVSPISDSQYFTNLLTEELIKEK